MFYSYQAIRLSTGHEDLNNAQMPPKKVEACIYFTAVIVKHTALISTPGSWPGHCVIGIYTESCPTVNGFPIDR